MTMGKTTDLVYRMSQMLKGILTRDSAEAKIRDIICQQADEMVEEDERFQCTKNPLRIIDWISEGEVGPEPDTREAMYAAGQILENCEALGALGTVVFRCDNGKAYQLIVCAQICEASEADIKEALEMTGSNRFSVVKTNGKFWLTDRLINGCVVVKPAKFKSLKAWTKAVNEDSDTTFQRYFQGQPKT